MYVTNSVKFICHMYVYVLNCHVYLQCATLNKRVQKCRKVVELGITIAPV